MRLTIFHVKLVHTVIFWLLSACVLYVLFSGVADHITKWTWVAVGLVVLESVVLAEVVRRSDLPDLRHDLRCRAPGHPLPRVAVAWAWVVRRAGGAYLPASEVAVWETGARGRQSERWPG